MSVRDRDRIGRLDRPSYLSFAQYDARQFDGAITRGIVEAYVEGVDAVYSAGAATAELEASLADATDWDVRAIDVDEAVVSAARSRSLPENLTVETGDVCEPADGGYDAALAFGSVQELVGRPVEGLEGLREALRPGGVALVAVPNLADMLQVVHPEYVHLDEDSVDGRLAAADLGLPDGSALTQYGFTCEGQSFGTTEGLDFDPGALTPFEELARRAGFDVADATPLEEWAADVELASTGGERVEGFDLAVEAGFPVSVPVDPAGLVGEATGTPIQRQVDSFDAAAADVLASSIEQRGLEPYRVAQARDPELPPRVDCYVLSRP